MKITYKLASVMRTICDFQKCQILKIKDQTKNVMMMIKIILISVQLVFLSHHPRDLHITVSVLLIEK